MQYTIETTIKKPLKEVIGQFHDPSNYMKWMPGIKSHQIISGIQRDVGSKSIFKFSVNGRDFSIEETIIKNDATEIIAKYVSNGTVNMQTTKFSAINENKTSYEVQESFKLKGFMKVIGLVMPSSFKKQTKEFVEAFKEFCENQ